MLIIYHEFQKISHEEFGPLMKRDMENCTWTCQEKDNVEDCNETITAQSSVREGNVDVDQNSLAQNTKDTEDIS